ncbi:mRNA-capping enzyme isoform X2 [Eutrema salsugineum]|uniref:mRNA-capping enzyme isoform X2 n=1 Tax=Eutrema salsugineum TaxID=72664 RepID=UPI000CECE964|nr:mRNA-capping enzyme isoform X2 [Eutrema salsugineum]
MVATMDLNASPQPEEDDEPYVRHLEDYSSRDVRIESAVDIARREREERRKRMRYDKPTHNSQPVFRDQYYQNRNTKAYDRYKIPQGWLDCPASGNEIGFIVPSKVPLNESYNSHVPPGSRYSFKQVIHNQRIAGRKLGLVIDLTNTTRYYSTTDLKKEGIKHVKIACKGRDAVPDNVSVNAFVNEVNQFVLNLKHSKKYILVHCTHGHNRTGFMIVHYLMRSGPMNVTQRSTELDLNGEALPDDDDDDGGPAGSVQEETHQVEVKLSNDDILGDEIPPDQEEGYRQFFYRMLSLNIGGRGCSQFPGSHPVSLNRDNLQLLRQRYYYATWKADGTRYMMLLTIDGCYIVDRSFRFRRVQMRFPFRHPTEGISDKVHHYTLLDGEMIIDTLPDKQRQERRYLIYDMVAINGQSVVERPFYERWKMLEKEVIEPRNHEKVRSHIYRYDLEPFRVRRKDFWLLSAVEKVLKGFIPSLSHEADGLIFQGWDDPYVARTHEGLLKWKYPEMNSVDFLYEQDESGRGMLSLFERGKKKHMDGNTVVFRDDSDPAEYSGKIVECSWDQDEKVWVSMRFRVDKSTPNDINTYRKVMRSIKDNITEEVLLQEIREIIRLPMYADRIQMDSKAARRR